MTGGNVKPSRRPIWKYLLAMFMGCLLLLGGLAWYVTTDSFQAMVRRRLIAELQKVTGGRVELGSFHTTPFRLRVEVRDLTIHGTEKSDSLPYAHVARVVAEMKVVSVLGFEFGFHDLILDHPVIHIITYPDGSTNQPGPKVAATSGKTAIEQLFKLSIGRLEVRSGELLWNDQAIPLDFSANDISSEMSYSVLRRRYLGKLLLGKVVTGLQDYRPVAWMAEVHFSLGRDRIDIGSFRANSGRSRLEATGSVKDFRDPHIEAKYDAQLDIAEFAAVARRSEPRGGSAEAQGHGTWSWHDFSTSGRVLVKDFGWRDRSLNVANVSGAGQFSVTPQRLGLTQIEARLLGGNVAGNLDVTDWLSRQPMLRSIKVKTEEQKGTGRFRVRDISAGALADAISRPGLQLSKINLAGAASGTVDVRWKGDSRKSEVSVALDVVSPVSPSPRQFPLNGRVRGTYYAESGEMEVDDLSATTRSTQVQAAGRLGRSGALKLSVASSDLREWEPVFQALGKPERIPALLHGHAAFTGTASGTVPSLSFAGHLQAQDFDYLLPANSERPEQSVHWDSLDANIQLSPHLFAVRSGSLQHSGTTISFGLAVALAHWQFAGQSPFTARFAVHHAEIAELLPLAGYNYPVTGTVNLYLQASGTRAQPQATGRVELSDVKARGESVQHLDAGVEINGDEIQLNHIEMAYNAARVNGGADYNFSSKVFHTDLSGTNFDVAHFAAGHTGRVRLGGEMDVAAHGSGTFEKPAINATLHLHNLSVDGQREGDFTVQAITQGPELHLTGRSQFQPAELAIDGDVHMRDGWPATVKLQFGHLGLDAALRPYLEGRLTGLASVSGELQVQGPLRDLSRLVLTGTLSDLSVDVENMKLHNQGTIEFAVSSETLRLKTFRLVGEGTDFSAQGTVQTTADRALSLRARGEGNLKLLESFDSSFTSSGKVALDMDVSGTVSKPVIQGRVQITDGSVAYLDLPSAFTGITGSLSFNQARMQIENLTAHTGGGLVTFGGNAAWINNQLSFDVTLKEKDVRLRYPPGISSTADADLHFVGNSTASTFSGDVTVTKLSVMPGFDFGAYLARSSRSAALPVTNPTLNRIRLDVHIVTTPELQMQTAVVRLSGDADLHLRGSAAKPVILGRAEVLEGEVSFNGTKYELERGEVTFKNPVITTPELDLQATTHVRDYDITLGMNGEPDKLKVTYRSEPPLPEADIITLLALGRTTTESAQLQESGQATFTQEASSAIINQALNATVTNRAQRLFGVSRIKVDPEGLNSETTLGRGPAVTIEEQVANNLTITYSTSVEQASQQIIQVVYNLPRNISIVAIRDQNGVLSFDVKIRRRKK